MIPVNATHASNIPQNVVKDVPKSSRHPQQVQPNPDELQSEILRLTVENERLRNARGKRPRIPSPDSSEQHSSAPQRNQNATDDRRTESGHGVRTHDHHSPRRTKSGHGVRIHDHHSTRRTDFGHGARTPDYSPSRHSGRVNFDSRGHRHRVPTPPPYAHRYRPTHSHRHDFPEESNVRLDRRTVEDIVAREIRGRSTRNDQIRDLAVMGFQHYPFSDYIRNYRRPTNFKKPDFEIYDEENGDPYTHLFYYRSQMAMENDDALLCKLFPATLKGDALVWFNSLTSKSIRNFLELAKKFVDHYQCNCEIKQDSAALFNLTKNFGESLRDFRKRFQTLLNVTDPPSDQFIIQAFKDAIGYDRNGLYNSLTRQSPFSKSELFDRAEEFARVEDDLKARQLQEENLQKNKKESGRTPATIKDRTETSITTSSPDRTLSLPSQIKRKRFSLLCQ
ncbi:hypothetical protein IFM89_023539 [Coptis chinensis]|uniref:Retrotransposon gag domain-containing protein n=1 Tax=Coptis chinensis TaxID=261450 RepID=A0A835IGS2_9MAGN|nr:hypothetical protein IFM89_023539 [Coptis chinensis]